MFEVKFNKNDVEAAFLSIMAKNPVYNRYWLFYDGDHPKTFMTKRLMKLFKDIDVNFTENWCAVVVDSMLERINLNGFKVVDDEETTKLIEDVWNEVEFKFEVEEIHEMALVTGEGFLIVWGDKEGKIQAYANDSRHCHAFYYGDNPRVMRYAAKVWQAGGRYFMTLYYPDRLEYYISKDEAKKTKKASGFIPIIKDGFENPSPNPFGKIPVFHFRTSRRIVKSELKSAIDSQNVINKSLNDMMASQEFQSAPQKYIISNAPMGKLTISPDNIWNLSAGEDGGQNTQVGQFDAAKPDGFIMVMDRSANVISATTRTPKHYFFSNQGFPSGEALYVMESPLNNKCQDRIDRFSPTWKKAVAFILNVLNPNDGDMVKASEIIPLYERPGTVQPKTIAEIRNLSVKSGLPLITLLRREGWSEVEINQFVSDKAEEELSRQNTLAAAVMNAQADLNAGLQDNGQLMDDNG